MKNLLFCFTVLICNYNASAQSKVNGPDTIHLRGVIYTYDGKPAKNFSVSARPSCLQCEGVRLNAVTDSDGYFTLEGAKPRDTIAVTGGGAYYQDATFENKGSRYMVIYLPKEYTVEIGKEKPIIVTAKRKFPKITPAFKMNSANVCFFTVDIGASLPAGQSFDSYLQKRLHYPQQAIDHNIEGTVQIGFDILKDGTLANFKLLKGIGYGCDEEVISLLKNSPHWRPAINNGKPLTEHATVSVAFKLSDRK